MEVQSQRTRPTADANPLSPPLRSPQQRPQGHPAKSKFLAANNMKRILLIITVVCSVLMSGASAAPIQPEADKAYEALFKLLKEYKIIGVAQGNYTLGVRHKTNKFMIHTIHKTGYISPKPIEVEGPNYDGLLIEASVRMGKYGGQAEIPQELERTYWKTFINAYPVDEGKSHLYLSISYGSRTDKEMIEKIKKCFGPIVKPVSSDKITKGKPIKK
jgi:hypothetical protein